MQYIQQGQHLHADKAPILLGDGDGLLCGDPFDLVWNQLGYDFLLS